MTVLELLSFVRRLACICVLCRFRNSLASVMTFYTILFIRCNYKPRLELSITTLHDLNRRVDVLSLQLYTELSDIKRVIINTHAIESQVYTSFVLLLNAKSLIGFLVLIL